MVCRFFLSIVFVGLVSNRIFALEAPDIFVGPFSHWLNLKTDYGAVGDGIADDASKLQAALTAIQQAGGNKTLYIPAGTYRITSTINMQASENMRIVGAHPDSVTIKWDGIQDGDMFMFNGVRQSNLERVTLDGSAKKAGRGFHIGIDYNIAGAFFPTGWGIYDVRFIDLKIGAVLGNPNCQSEASYERCLFKNCTTGMSLVDANTANIWIRYCIFEDCGTGVSGGAHATVLNSIFRRSTTLDIGGGNMGYFGIRHCFSTGSRMFYENTDGLDGRPAIIEGNTIIDPTGPYPLNITGVGPLTVFDNTIRSLSTATAPEIYRNTTSTMGLFAENTFTVGTAETAIRTTSIAGATGRIINNHIVDRATINATEPEMPSIPIRIPSNAPNIFQPTAFTGAAIQTAIINAVSAYPSSRSIVYLKGGTYSVSSTIAIPKNAPVYILGDLAKWGGQVLLKWTGSNGGTMIKFAGPGNKATIQNMFLDGNGNASGIVIDSADQQGGRIYMSRVECDLFNTPTPDVGLFVDRLDWTRIEICGTGGGFSGKNSMKIIGGPYSEAGQATTAGVICWNGGMCGGPSATLPSFDISKNGRLMSTDTWLEEGGWPYRQPILLMGNSSSGTVTFQGYKMQFHTNGVGTSTIFGFNGFSGKVSIFNFNALQNVIVEIGGSNPLQNVMFATDVWGYGDPVSNPTPKSELNSKITITATQGQTAIINCGQACPSFDTLCQYGHTYPYQNPVGTPTDQWVLDMMDQARSNHPQYPGLLTIPQGVIDVKLMWVGMQKLIGNGIRVNPRPTTIKVNGRGRISSNAGLGNMKMLLTPGSRFLMPENANHITVFDLRGRMLYGKQIADSHDIASINSDLSRLMQNGMVVVKMLLEK